MALAFAQIAKEEGFSPFFLTPSVSLHHTLRRNLHLNFPPLTHRQDFQGYPCYQMGASFPEFESRAHRFDQRSLDRILDSCASCFAISGNNHAARPFLDTGRPYSVWTATTFWEDCEHRIEQTHFSPRKLLDLLSKPMCGTLEHRVFKRSNKIAVISTYTRDHVLRLDPQWATKVQVIHPPVDCAIYQPLLKERQPTILFVGRLSDPRKNLSLLLTAFSRCAREVPDLQLELMGSAEPATPQMLSNHPYAHRIHWKGPATEADKIHAIQRSLVLVIPSFQEGFAIVGAEALACGTPVVSTRCGGTTDHVLHEQTGLLVEDFDPQSLADAILRLIHDPLLYAKLSRQARDFAEKHLSLQAIRPHLQRLICN